MKEKWIIFIAVSLLFQSYLSADRLHTIDRKVYEGKMVAFKFDTVYFNVKELGESHSLRFPLSKIWKIEFNPPRGEGLEHSSEIEQYYTKFRKGKRTKKVVIQGTDQWIDSGIDVKVGQDVLFAASGLVYIDKSTVVYQNGEGYVNWNNKKPLPNQPTGAVIGKVGKESQPFYIGDDKAPFQMAQTGRLFIGINDFDLTDNSGHFEITIYY